MHFSVSILRLVYFLVQRFIAFARPGAVFLRCLALVGFALLVVHAFAARTSFPSPLLFCELRTL